jgi:putative Holliday junction resolvase
MRILALDAGEVRCGCAVCDPTETVVTPIELVERPATRKGLDTLARLVREREIEKIVVGLPLTLVGKEGEQAKWSRNFADKLAGKTNMPVTMFDERLTTRQALRGGGEMSTDSRAAAHLLEAYLAASRGGAAQ